MRINKKGEGHGIGFFGVLLAVFIGLKIAGLIKWSWWLVFSPLWIEIIIVLIVLLIMWLNDWNDWGF